MGLPASVSVVDILTLLILTLDILTLLLYINKRTFYFCVSHLPFRHYSWDIELQEVTGSARTAALPWLRRLESYDLPSLCLSAPTGTITTNFMCLMSCWFYLKNRIFGQMSQWSLRQRTEIPLKCTKE